MQLKKMTTTELLDKLYYDPNTGFQSMEKLFFKAKQYNNSITRVMVQNFLNNQPSYQLTKPIKHIKYSTIVSKGVRNNFQMILYIYQTPQQLIVINIY